MSDLTTQPVRRSSKLVCFLLTMAVFVILGPPVGAFAAWLAASVQAIPAGIAAGAPLSSALVMLVMMVIFGYPVGFYFALVAGVIVAAAGVWGHWNGFLVPVVAAAIASVVVVLATKFLSPPESPELKILGLFPICLVASLVCWFITRNIVRAAWARAS